MYSKLVRLKTLTIVVLGLAVLLIWPTTAAEAAKSYAIDPAQSDCGSLQVEILGREPSPSILPRDGGQTLIVAPDGSLDVIVRNPPANGFLEIKLTGVPEDVLQRRFKFEGAGPVEQAFDVPVKDYAGWGHGVYEVDFALLDSSERPICQTTARVRIDGFGGVVGYASAAATAVAGIGVVANIIGNIKSGLLQARIKASVAPAAARIMKRGTGRSYLSPKPWAYAYPGHNAMRATNKSSGNLLIRWHLQPILVSADSI